MLLENLKGGLSPLHARHFSSLSLLEGLREIQPWNSAGAEVHQKQTLSDRCDVLLFCFYKAVMENSHARPHKESHRPHTVSCLLTGVLRGEEGTMPRGPHFWDARRKKRKYKQTLLCQRRQSGSQGRFGSSQEEAVGTTAAPGASPPPGRPSRTRPEDEQENSQGRRNARNAAGGGGHAAASKRRLAATSDRDSLALLTGAHNEALGSLPTVGGKRVLPLRVRTPRDRGCPLRVRALSSAVLSRAGFFSEARSCAPTATSGQHVRITGRVRRRWRPLRRQGHGIHPPGPAGARCAPYPPRAPSQRASDAPQCGSHIPFLRGRSGRARGH